MYTLTDITALAEAMAASLESSFQTKFWSGKACDNGRPFFVAEVSFAGINVRFDTEFDDEEDAASVITKGAFWVTSVELDERDPRAWFAESRFLEGTDSGYPGASGTASEVIALGREMICFWLIQSGRQALSEGFSSWEVDSEEEELGEP